MLTDCHITSVRLGSGYQSSRAAETATPEPPIKSFLASPAQHHQSQQKQVHLLPHFQQLSSPSPLFPHKELSPFPPQPPTHFQPFPHENSASHLRSNVGKVSQSSSEHNHFITTPHPHHGPSLVTTPLPHFGPKSGRVYSVCFNNNMSFLYKFFKINFDLMKYNIWTFDIRLWLHYNQQFC